MQVWAGSWRRPLPGHAEYSPGCCSRWARFGELAAADMALAGIRSVIPADEVIQAMGAIGRELPVSLRETALGGLAATPTGKRIASEINAAVCSAARAEEEHLI